MCPREERRCHENRPREGGPHSTKSKAVLGSRPERGLETRIEMYDVREPEEWQLTHDAL